MSWFFNFFNVCCTTQVNEKKQERSSLSPSSCVSSHRLQYFDSRQDVCTENLISTTCITVKYAIGIFLTNIYKATLKIGSLYKTLRANN
jgi:arginine decarboxylase-like protein